MIWQSRLSPYIGQDRTFHDWFVKYQVQRIKENMLKIIRGSWTSNS